MTLALLITAVGGAWATDPNAVTAAEINSDVYSGWTSIDEKLFKASELPGFQAVTEDQAKSWAGVPSTGYVILYYEFVADGNVKAVRFENGVYVSSFEEDELERYLIYEDIYYNGDTKYFYTTGPAPALEPAVEVTTNAASKQDLFTEAKFNMPTFDVDVNYTLVRDMQDETNPVAFSGLPSSGNIVVKKGDDGKYQPIEALTIQLIDPLAAAEAQNIIAADGITIKVLVGDDSNGPVEYDDENPITLEAFLADMKPGYYWIKAVPTDETTSPYIGTVYSSEFTVVEKYDLTVKPANDFSKGKVESVTVGSGSVTIDANTGEAAKTGIDPETEVKIKAKRGYVIDKVEVKKAGPALKTLTVTGVATKSINYAEGDTWQQAIERPENAGSGWRVQGDYIFNGGITLMIGSGYVRPGHTIDATKNYSLEAD